MDPIPMPEVLDPDRQLINDANHFTTDHESRADALQDAFERTSSYAQRLWRELDAVRGYLVGCVPPEHAAPDADAPLGARPTGPDDEEGWARWQQAYASVTSLLCGPQGDSGFGESEARREADHRRRGTAARAASHRSGCAEAGGAETGGEGAGGGEPAGSDAPSAAAAPGGGVHTAALADGSIAYSGRAGAGLISPQQSEPSGAPEPAQRGGSAPAGHGPAGAGGLDARVLAAGSAVALLVGRWWGRRSARA